MNTPALQQLADGYFHLDWLEIYGDEGAVVDDFLEGEPDLAPLLPDEIRALLAEPLTEAELQAHLYALGSCYTVAPDSTYREWLTEVMRRTESYLTQH